MNDKIIEIASELQSIAQAGLYYGKDVYDKERYERIRELSCEILAIKTDTKVEDIKNLFAMDYGYQTPKVDTRAVIFKDGKLLLIKENNGTWSLPGGWCEYNLSPALNTIKETKEEAGLDIKIKSVISVQDRSKHNKPEYVYGVVKIFYMCELIGGEFEENIEIVESKYFSFDEIPPLANEKNNLEQIKMCFDAYNDENFITQFD